MMGHIDFIPLSKKQLPLLYEWFKRPHIKRWYTRREAFSMDEIESKYLPRIKTPENIPNFIVTLDNNPVGYIQAYRLHFSLPEGVKDYNHLLFKSNQAEHIVGIDFFIADINLLQQGLGSRIIKQFIAQQLKEKYKLAVVDPHKNNHIAIKFFKKNGFSNLTFHCSEYELLLYDLRL